MAARKKKKKLTPAHKIDETEHISCDPSELGKKLNSQRTQQKHVSERCSFARRCYVTPRKIVLRNHQVMPSRGIVHCVADVFRTFRPIIIILGNFSCFQLMRL